MSSARAKAKVYFEHLSDKELENLSELVEEIPKLHKYDGLTAYGFYQRLQIELDRREDEKGVIIKTTCGQEIISHPDQAVASITIDGKQVYPSKKEVLRCPTNMAECKQLIETCQGGKWKFIQNMPNTRENINKMFDKGFALCVWAFDINGKQLHNYSSWWDRK